MQTKDILIWLGVFIVGSLIVSFLIYPTSFQSFKSNVKSILPSTSNNNPSSITSKTEILTNFEDLERNPENYVDKKLTIKGKFVIDYVSLCVIYLPKNCYGFGDSNGYYVKILLKNDRAFNPEQSYTFTGIFTRKDYEHIAGTKIESFYYLAEE